MFFQLFFVCSRLWFPAPAHITMPAIFFCLFTKISEQYAVAALRLVLQECDHGLCAFFVTLPQACNTLYIDDKLATVYTIVVKEHLRTFPRLVIFEYTHVVQ